MRKLVALLGVGLLLLGAPAFAQDISGQWQGTAQIAQETRTVLKVSGTAAGGLSGQLWTNINVSPEPLAVDSISLAGSTLKFTVKSANLSFEGVLSADGRKLDGVFNSGGQSVPLVYDKATAQTAWTPDPSPHTASFVTTDDKVKLEVLDWGGTGRPVLFLAGLGATAHVFDSFAPRLTGKYHVYAMTRRGFGQSDRPDPATGNYMADRLGDDVLRVMDALKLQKPVLAGWSMGGEELSSIATRFPEKVSGLVYLDAAMPYSFYAPGNVGPPGANLTVAANDLRAKVQKINAPGTQAAEASALIEELLKTSLPQLQVDLEAERAARANGPQQPTPPAAPITLAVLNGMQKYTGIKPPVLALYAYPTAALPNASPDQRLIAQNQDKQKELIIRRFEAGNPKAKVVRVPNARHNVFTSNPDDVLREMTAFIDGLK